MAVIDSLIMRQLVMRGVGGLRGGSHNSLTIHEYGKTTYGQLLRRHLCQRVKDKSKSTDERGRRALGFSSVNTDTSVLECVAFTHTHSE